MQQRIDPEGHAVAFHEHPRAAKDMDELIRASVANAMRVYEALAASEIPPESFSPFVPKSQQGGAGYGVGRCRATSLFGAGALLDRLDISRLTEIGYDPRGP